MLYYMQSGVYYLALCISVGYTVAAFFPCDPGSPVSGTFRQGVHNIAGAIEYVGGGFAMLTLEPTHGIAFRHLAYFVLGAVFFMTIMPSTLLRGLIQRLAEVSLFGALALAAAKSSGGEILNKPTPESRPNQSFNTSRFAGSDPTACGCWSGYVGR